MRLHGQLFWDYVTKCQAKMDNNLDHRRYATSAERKLLQGRCIVALWLSIYLSIYLLTFFNLPRPATAATAAATTTTATA